jgi:hypothetical protein
MDTQNQLNNLERSLGRVEGKIEEGFKGIYQRLDVMNGRLNGHDTKIDVLETDITTIKTKATIFGAGAGFSVMILWEFIKNKIFKL